MHTYFSLKQNKVNPPFPYTLKLLLKMAKTTNFPHQEKKPPPPTAAEEEEALSLRDFPLSSDEPPEKKEHSKIQDKRRSSSEPSEFFEFFHDFTSEEMSNAEDIIFCGKLMPYKNPPRILKSLSADDATRLHRSGAAVAAAERRNRLPRSGGGRSMDCRRLIVKPEATDIHRSSSKSSVKLEGTKAAAAVVVKPRWFVMMFGPLKLQPEMDLRDIKNRQVRRNPRSLFSTIDGGGGNRGGRSDRRSFWGLDLLKVLSCKNHANVAVTTSIGLVPHF